MFCLSSRFDSAGALKDRTAKSWIKHRVVFQCCSLAKTLTLTLFYDVDFLWEHPCWSIHSWFCKSLCTHGVHAFPQLLQRWAIESRCNTVNSPIKMEQNGMSVQALSPFSVRFSVYASVNVCVFVCMPASVYAHTHMHTHTHTVYVWESDASLANLVGEGVSGKARVPLKREAREAKDRARWYIYKWKFHDSKSRQTFSVSQDYDSSLNIHELLNQARDPWVLGPVAVQREQRKRE